MPEQTVLAARGVAVRRGGADVIRDATFELGPGVWLLRGPNGSGKSTLLRVLGGVGRMWRGSVEIGGHDLDAAPVAARGALGFLPQSAEIFGYLTVRGFLETVAALRRTDVAAPLRRAKALIHERCVDQRIDTLSAGQRRKLCLCAALTGSPRVLLLDEPDAALDDAAVAELARELSGLQEQGRAALIATHHALAGASPRGTLFVKDGIVAL